MTQSLPRPFGHESSTINVRLVLVIGALLTLIVVVAATAIHLSLKYWITPYHAQVVQRASPIPPLPRLQPYPQKDLAELLARKTALLSEWQWTDSGHAYARIPIERAMSLLLAQRSTRNGTRPEKPEATP